MIAIPKKILWLMAALLVTGALAGCAAPEEEVGEEPGAEPGIDVGEEEEALGEEEEALGEEEEALGEEDEALGTAEGDQEQDVENVVIINGAVYACDTFAEATNAVEGQCDEYQLAEDEDPALFDDAPEFQTDAEERVTINGMVYECDDDGLEGAFTDDEEAAANQTAEEDDAFLEEDRCEEFVLATSGE